MMRNAFFILLILIYVIPFAQPLRAQEINTQALAQTPILHEGRIKPLDSFARAQLKRLSGTEKDALPWLIEVLFDPRRAQERPVIKITHPDILTVLHLERRHNKFYSYAETSKALGAKQALIRSLLESDEAQWTPSQRRLVILQDKLITLQNLFDSLTLFLPLSLILPEDIPENLQPLAGKTLTYMESIPFAAELEMAVKDILARKGEALGTYNTAEQAVAQLSFTLNMMQKTQKRNVLFKIIKAQDTWLTPWEALADKDARGTQIFTLWQDLARAYHSNNIESWNARAEELHHLSTGNIARPAALRAEYYYNVYNPFKISFALCLLGLLALLVTLFYKNSTLMKISLFCLISSLIAHISGLSLRVFILERPPVSTLYETILFVGFITLLYVLLAFRQDRKIFWLWLGVIAGVFLHLLGFAHQEEGDSFVMLSAVLNTNFWLTTHVLCITAGYGFCALTSLLAHYVLLKMARDKTGEPDESLFQNMLTAALLALFFATIGTVLGGIWADQSWGRFWGWDPKENGALLIVLWLIWTLHGRISGQMGAKAVLCGLSFLSFILALSWFGVNLLGVGLHAYGFTDSAAWFLGLFGALEILFLLGINHRIQSNREGKTDG